MSASIEIRKLNLDGFSPDELHDEAQRLRQFVYRDFLRLGISEEDARSISDPDNEEEALTQLDKIISPRYPDTVYAKLLSGEEVAGYTKVGPRLPGDEAPFGRRRRILASVRELGLATEAVPRGLHALAVREGLTHAALTRIYYDLVPANQQLVASVHERDSELQDAFTDLGANTKAPQGSIMLGSYAASYSRRALPPHRGRQNENE